jgi:HD-GYP domain-containing protein (c-di-GMP phosphodiesterase class II)
LRQSLDTPPESTCAEGFLAYAAFPLVVRGEVRGLLEVGHRSPLAPDTDWVEFLEALAGQAAVAVDVASQAERQRRAHLELNTACDAAVEGWSRAMDLRDHEIEGHSRRVTDMTLRLARALGIGDDSLVQIRHGSLLHDIGKLVISDAILRKPGPLTDEEWVVMRTHPQRALEMLAPIPFLHAAMDIPFCHHELWDGSGYPRGLKGEQIPLAARIFTAVDIWDALSYDRPYRNAWPREQVEAHLRTLAGVHLDPAIAALLLRTLAAVADEARAATPEAPVLIEDPRR